jgi:hypothetical protein
MHAWMLGLATIPKSWAGDPVVDRDSVGMLQSIDMKRNEGILSWTSFTNSASSQPEPRVNGER